MKKMITLQRPLIVGLTEFHCIHWILPLACAIQHVSGAGQSLFLWYLLTALFRLRAPAPCSVFSNSTHRSAHQTFQPAPFSAPLTCSDFAVWFKLLQPAATKRILVQFSPHSSALVFARWQHHNARAIKQRFKRLLSAADTSLYERHQLAIASYCISWQSPILHRRKLPTRQYQK